MAQRKVLPDDWHPISALSADVLRVHPEPCHYINDTAVHAALTADPSGYVRFLEQHLRDIATGHSRIEMPSKAIFTDGPGLGDFRVMPCVLRAGSTTVKTVKIVGTNVTEVQVPDQITVGKAFALHPHDNFITHVYDACLLSSARTGACATIGLEHLARKRDKVAIVGAGRVAYYIALYAAAHAGVREFVFYDVRRDRAEAIAAWGNAELGATCTAAGTHKVSDCDVVVLATTSNTPLFSPGDFRANLVISVGADTEEQRELSSSWAACADIYADVIDSVKVGDIRAWISEGAISPGDITDLLSLLRVGPRHGTSRPRVFVSTGSALFDNLTIAYLQAAN